MYSENCNVYVYEQKFFEVFVIKGDRVSFLKNSSLKS